MWKVRGGMMSDKAPEASGALQCFVQNREGQPVEKHRMNFLQAAFG